MRQDPKFRKVIAFEYYFEEFFIKQNPRVQEKILWTIELIEDLEVIPSKYLKHITGSNGIYEIRVKAGSNIFRIFSFFDEETLVILANGYQKKTRKTDRKQIQKALNIRKEYEKGKE